MAKQRYIHDSFWTDPYIESLNIEEKLLFLYYLTNPLCNIAGIYEIRDSRISYELSIPENKIKIIKNKFVKDKKILIYKDWICFFNFAKHQTHNPNVLKGMQRVIDELPSNLKALKGFERLSHFTLLNLTLLNSTSKEEKDFVKTKSPIKSNNIKTMWKEYKETEINYETGETIKEPTKIPQNKTATKLMGIFQQMCEERLKVKPLIKKGAYFLVLKAMENLSPEKIVEMMDEWFDSGKEEENLMQITQCFSYDRINRFNIAKKNDK